MTPERRSYYRAFRQGCIGRPKVLPARRLSLTDCALRLIAQEEYRRSGMVVDPVILERILEGLRAL